jgi:hypothetical protein
MKHEQCTEVYLQDRFVWLWLGDILTRRRRYLPRTACSDSGIIPLIRGGGKFYHFIIISMTIKNGWIRDSSVNIATGWTVGARFLPGVRNRSLLHIVQTGCGAHPASYPLSLGVKRLRHKADYSPPSGEEAKYGWVISPHGSVHGEVQCSLFKRDRCYNTTEFGVLFLSLCRVQRNHSSAQNYNFTGYFM